ncbi:MAG: hypothetical protein COB08_009225 [Rhodobacteraceae bacterium]|nr:hypothetical protein [Paracoccaceae bacterium]
MDTFLSKEVLNGLDRARKQAQRKKNRLRLHVGDEIYPLLRLSDDGFEMDAEAAPHLRGFVDIYDGAKHLSSCLIIHSETEGNIMRYEYKRHTNVADGPAKDFVVDENAPVALIGR